MSGGARAYILKNRSYIHGSQTADHRVYCCSSVMSNGDLNYTCPKPNAAARMGLLQPSRCGVPSMNSGRKRPSGRWMRFCWWLSLLAACAGLSVLLTVAGEAPPAADQPVAIDPLPVLPAAGSAARDALPEVFGEDAPASVAQLEAIERHVRELVARVSPAVVAVRVGMATGSGVVVSADGLVLSAAHVGVEPGRDVRFSFPDGRTARGRTLGMNHGMDAGLMRITEAGVWPHAELGDPDSGALGDWVMALGHPGGFDAERPVLARLGRIIWRAGGSIRTDCTLVSGDSGGPLFDMHGRVIGIHSRISESTAANFHAPIGSYVSDWERLARGDNWGAREPRSRAWVGLRGVDHPEGVRLEQVFEGGPAFKAGLRGGDLVTRFNGRPVTDYGSFLRALSQIQPGEQVTLDVRRDDEAWEAEVTVEARRRGGGPFGRR
jgi:serine protease Do